MVERSLLVGTPAVNSCALFDLVNFDNIRRESRSAVVVSAPAMLQRGLVTLERCEKEGGLFYLPRYSTLWLRVTVCETNRTITQTLSQSY